MSEIWSARVAYISNSDEIWGRLRGKYSSLDDIKNELIFALKDRNPKCFICNEYLFVILDSGVSVYTLEGESKIVSLDFGGQA